MSDVRLSNGSPTLDRTADSRVPPDHPKPSACRNLFGAVDHEELKRDLKGHLREMEADARDKWGFDFAANTPLANGTGRITWELVDCRTVPDFYTRQPHREKGVCSAGNNHVDLNGNHSCVVVSPTEDRSDGQMECTEQCAAGIRKRHACHERSTQNKRTHSSGAEEMSCPSLSRSTEHTPRKKSPKRQTSHCPQPEQSGDGKGLALSVCLTERESVSVRAMQQRSSTSEHLQRRGIQACETSPWGEKSVLVDVRRNYSTTNISSLLKTGGRC
ncbi:hypothetical protein WMY93_022851 [Mugilogobius chulae]|uniref:Cyclin-dependent kinase inhibitor 1B n=1 Tax=Mugilogobius chulae TaxID=88201 RepID=A0AAW0ND60_9GOBI